MTNMIMWLEHKDTDNFNDNAIRFLEFTDLSFIQKDKKQDYLMVDDKVNLLEEKTDEEKKKDEEKGIIRNEKEDNARASKLERQVFKYVDEELNKDEEDKNRWIVAFADGTRAAISQLHLKTTLESIEVPEQQKDSDKKDYKWTDDDIVALTEVFFVSNQSY